MDIDFRSFPIVVVDDEEDNLDAFRFAFRKAFNLSYAVGGQAGLELLDRVDAAVVVSDQRMPNMSGIEFLHSAKQRRPDAVGILLTAYADLQVLIDAVNSGAVDRYVQKPWDSKELTVILKQGIRSFATVRDNRRLREQLAQYAGYLEREQRDPFDYGELAGESAAMQTLARQIEEVALSASPVLLDAEAGSEYEVVARAIHVGSSREPHPFVRVTCAAFRGDALERELFGWRRGSFPGAFDDRPGRFELADRGTILLDNPETPTRALQARLVRLLQDGSTERVGSAEAHPVDARLILALPGGLARWRSADLLSDLESKLGVITIRIPPIRERKEDIAVLAEHFLNKYRRRNSRAAAFLSDAAKECLRNYDFPGNAREIENVVERAAILARGEQILPEHLAFSQRGDDMARSDVELPQPPEPTTNLGSRLEEIERSELIAALERCHGNKAEVARSLGIQRTTLYYRLKRLGIDG